MCICTLAGGGGCWTYLLGWRLSAVARELLKPTAHHLRVGIGVATDAAADAWTLLLGG